MVIVFIKQRNDIDTQTEKVPCEDSHLEAKKEAFGRNVTHGIDNVRPYDMTKSSYMRQRYWGCIAEALEEIEVLDPNLGPGLLDSKTWQSYFLLFNLPSLQYFVMSAITD